VWRERRDLGPMQRWLRALTDVVLVRARGRVVVFVDEIDAVRSLPFSTDEFFAGIRELYNRRTQDEGLERLTFCLLGVASPSDLIRDTRTTPFNVGRRIELGDFTRSEAASLERGLGRDEAEGRGLLDRVLYWTGGHPYLTQRLCQAVAEDAGVRDGAGVDRLCDDLFLSRRARERDDNLLFVRDRMLRAETDLAELLELYRRVRSGLRVPDDDANPLISVLKLAGIARVEDGALRVRNRIYERVFDDEWIRASMPGAEVRRQRRAFTKGALRTAAAAGVVLLVIALLLVDAIRQRNRAEEQRAIAEDQRRIAETATATNRRLLYDAHINLAYQAVDRRDFVRAAQLLDDEATAPERGFEFFYLWRVVHADALTIYSGSFVEDVEFSPDGSMLATATDNAVAVWDTASGQQIVRFENGKSGGGFNLAFSADGSTLAIAGSDAALRYYNSRTGALVREVKVDPIGVNSVACAPFARVGATEGYVLVTAGYVSGKIRVYGTSGDGEPATIDTGGNMVGGIVLSDDGSLLAVGQASGDVVVWDVASRRKVVTLPLRTEFVRALAFSPNNRSLVTATSDGQITLRDLATGSQIRMLREEPGSVGAVKFSRDGRMIALGIQGLVEVRDLDGREIASFPGHTDQILDVAFSPDGMTVASASVDQTARTWRLADRNREVPVLTGHKDSVYAVDYSPDGQLLATASYDKTAALWDARGNKLRTFDGHTGWLFSVKFSPDGRLLATGGEDRTMRLWEVATGQLVHTFVGFEERIFSVAFSPDGRLVAAGCFDGLVRIWDVATFEQVRVLRVEPKTSIECIAFSPDGTLLAAGGENKSVELWRVSDGELVGTLTGHADWVNSLAFSPDGRLLATAGSYGDTTVGVWDVASRSRVYTLKGFSGASGFTARSYMGPTGRPNCVRFSPDGLTLAVSTVDRTVKLFDVQTGQEYSTLATPHANQVYGLAFSPDSETLATTSEDGTVRLWRTASRQRVDETVARLRTSAPAPGDRTFVVQPPQVMQPPNAPQAPAPPSPPSPPADVLG
jgi:WD40 repeat protein